MANDTDANNDSLIVSAAGPPNSGQATISDTIAIVYTPTLNFTCTGVFTYSVTDNTFSSTAAVTVTVTPNNDAPTISTVSDITLTTSPSTGAQPFSVGDVESGGAVTVTAQSSNIILVPSVNIFLGGSGVNRAVTVISAVGWAGQVAVTLTVSDDHAATAKTRFVVTVLP